jgi:glycosyltransferase involved in cell wall biosynthesis
VEARCLPQSVPFRRAGIGLKRPQIWLRDPTVSDMPVELGVLSYHQLQQLYVRADVYVTPAYAETFAHPLVVAMASGSPVIVSDLAVHREICRDAEVYFPRFSSEKSAEAVAQVLRSEEASECIVAIGLERARVRENRVERIHKC